MARSENSYPTQIICESPVSEKLLYQLNEHFIPTLSKFITWCNEVKIIADVDKNVLENAKAVGAGISGGVDSYYSLLKAINENSEHFKPTHGLFCDIEDFGEINQQYLDFAKEICQEANLQLVHVKSNVCSELYRIFHENIGACVILSSVLALEKLFKTYFYSSAHDYNSFKFDDYSGEKYTFFDAFCFSTDNTVNGIIYSIADGI